MDFYDYCNTPKQRAFSEEEEDEIVLEPYKHIVDAPQGLIRERTLEAFNYWMKIPDEKISKILELIKMIHSSSLIIDDIQDNSVLRRGVPVSNSIFGVQPTMNAAHSVSCRVIEKANELGPKCMEYTIELINNGILGQMMDIYWRDNFICPSLEEYRDMVKKKTAVIYIWAWRVLELFGTNKEVNLESLLTDIGVFFQIRDDYDILFSKKISEMKGFCDDISEGKFSFPIIHAVTSNPEDTEILDILKLRTSDIEIKKHCLSLIEKCGSKEYTKQYMQNMGRTIIENVKKLGRNPFVERLVDDIMKTKDGDYIIETDW